MAKDRRKCFKHLCATIFREDNAAGVELTCLRNGYGISVFLKPRKLAKELRRVARWLEKR